MMLFRLGLTSSFKNYSDHILTVLLLAGAALLILIALFSKSTLLKAVVLGWIVLP